MTQEPFDPAPLFRRDAPAAGSRAAPFPRYMFIGGHNDPNYIPIAELSDAATDMLAEHGAHLAKYNLGFGPQGFPPLREHVSDKVRRHRGIETSIDDILITHGSNQGIDLITDVFVEPGDVVLVEQVSYSAALNKFRKRGADLVPIALDDKGIVIADLTQRLDEVKREGKRAKLIYTIPTIQNPTGSILPLDRRHDLLALARKHGVAILEDECYADLAWNKVEEPALYALDPEIVIHIGSFSKSLAPALRLGYALARWDVLGRMIALKNDGGVGAIDQMVAAGFFSKRFDEHVAGLRQLLKRKMDVMAEALRAEFGTTAEFREPDGGIFIWITLPENIDVRTLVEPAAKVGLVFNPGPEWAAQPETARASLRLCFAYPDEQTIKDGVALLARVCHEAYGVPRFSANIARDT